MKVKAQKIAESAVINREVNFKLYPHQTYNYNGRFNTYEYESFKILITAIDHSNYPLTLAGSNDGTNYTTVKQWSSAKDSYEEIIDLLQNYQYFWIYGSQTNSYGGRILVRAISNSSNKELNYKMRVNGDRSYNMSFLTKDYEWFKIYITSVGYTSYPPKLYVSNSGVNWTLKKTWTTAHSAWEDITDLIKNYEYFYFMTPSTSYEGRFRVHCKTSK